MAYGDPPQSPYRNDPHPIRSAVADHLGGILTAAVLIVAIVSLTIMEVAA